MGTTIVDTESSINRWICISLWFELYYRGNYVWVPHLAWPIRGVQYYNAMLVVNHLKVVAMVSEKYPVDMVNKGEIKKQFEILGAKFEQGFPTSLLAPLDEFSDSSIFNWASSFLLFFCFFFNFLVARLGFNWL